MHFQFVVAPPTPTLPPTPALPTPTDMSVELLRQMLDVQREHLGLIQTQIANADHLVRWRNFLQRWESDFPKMGEACRIVLPSLERAYLQLIDDLVHGLEESESGDLCNEFALNEFLDRYGTRLGQLGTILNQIGTLADAAG